MSVVLSKADSRVLTQSNEGCVFMLATVCVSVWELVDCLGVSSLLTFPCAVWDTSIQSLQPDLMTCLGEQVMSCLCFGNCSLGLSGRCLCS